MRVRARGSLSSRRYRGQHLQLNADTVATALAKALNAEGLYLVTNVPGILRDPSDRSSLIPTCTASEAKALVENGTISGGMLPKVQNCLSALRGGVKQVRILDGSKEESLLLQSLLSASVGTVVVDESDRIDRTTRTWVSNPKSEIRIPNSQSVHYVHQPIQTHNPKPKIENRAEL